MSLNLISRRIREWWHQYRSLVIVDYTPQGIGVRIPRKQIDSYRGQPDWMRQTFLADVDRRARRTTSREGIE